MLPMHHQQNSCVFRRVLVWTNSRTKQTVTEWVADCWTRQKFYRSSLSHKNLHDGCKSPIKHTKQQQQNNACNDSNSIYNNNKAT